MPFIAVRLPTRTKAVFRFVMLFQDHLKTLDIHRIPKMLLSRLVVKQALLYALMASIVLEMKSSFCTCLAIIRWNDSNLGGVPIHVPVSRPSYHPDFEALEASITSRTKAIMLNSPNNLNRRSLYAGRNTKKYPNCRKKHDLWVLMIRSILTLIGPTAPTHLH